MVELKKDSSKFFDKQIKSKHYQWLKQLLRTQDQNVAKIFNARIRGSALSIGGVWDCFEWSSQLTRLTVLDSSPQMLQLYTPTRATPIVGDLYSQNFPVESFDAVIFPLILHHTALGGWHSAQDRIEEAIKRAYLWLKPNGSVYIYEHCVHKAWYLAQRLFLPLTRVFMHAISQPLVVLHPSIFFEQLVKKQFGSCETFPIDSPGLTNGTWLPLFLGAPWVKLPFLLYPKPFVFISTKT